MTSQPIQAGRSSDRGCPSARARSHRDTTRGMRHHPSRPPRLFDPSAESGGGPEPRRPSPPAAGCGQDRPRAQRWRSACGVLRQLGLPLRGVWALTSSRGSELPWATTPSATPHDLSRCLDIFDQIPKRCWNLTVSPDCGPALRAGSDMHVTTGRHLRAGSDQCDCIPCVHHMNGHVPLFP